MVIGRSMILRREGAMASAGVPRKRNAGESSTAVSCLSLLGLSNEMINQLSVELAAGAG